MLLGREVSGAFTAEATVETPFPEAFKPWRAPRSRLKLQQLLSCIEVVQPFALLPAPPLAFAAMADRDREKVCVLCQACRAGRALR